MENAVVLREWFDRVDAGRTGNITAAQLQGALAVGNLNFPISVVQQMIRMYDFDRNGTMSFEEFLALNKFLQKVQSVFSTLERGRGFLSLEEVYEALIKLGFSLDSPAFYTVCEIPFQYDCLRAPLFIQYRTCVFSELRQEQEGDDSIG
ncbi:hypothetical protein SORBI_3001G517100 [Sorghum bicolor]|uniref:EF-hand domain-containing protein n=1 Tax=Sorghum bicolor TaxID=4558 RepID=A0A1Z5SBV9_SORBI|nr:hypothetical protein SORBI_3001G517100 [Sorghum bicolor]